MNPTTQKLLDASESLASPMHSTNQAIQHTPGYYVSTFTDSGSTGKTCIRSPRGLVAAMEAGYQQTREQDAALIVRAVNSHADLLAALELCLVFLPTEAASATNKARAAIAKARQ